MLELTEEQIAARELRAAAYHEAGHKSMCRRFGGDGDAVVWKNPSRKPDERAWFGQFRMRVCPQAMHDSYKRAGHPSAELPTNWKALLGMAGAVAEEIMTGPNNSAELIAEELAHRTMYGAMSSTDLAQMGITDIFEFELDVDEVEQVRLYLKEDWPSIREEAEYLIAEASSLDG